MQLNAPVAAHKMMPLSVSAIVGKKRPHPEEYGDVDAGQMDCVFGAYV